MKKFLIVLLALLPALGSRAQAPFAKYLGQVDSAPFIVIDKQAFKLTLVDETGQPVPGGGNWSGFYGLDIYNEGVRGYLKRVFDTVLNKWGYGLVKLDFLYAACLVPRHDKTRAEIMLDGMKFLRSLCGNALILGCGVPLASAFGLVDYCRIGCDVSLSWNDKLYMRLFHRERPSTKNTILNTVFRRQLDGRAFRCDPDVFLLRDNNISLSAEQKRTLAVVNALFGGVLFTSDNVAEYSGDAMKLWREISGLSRDNFEGLAFEKNGTLRLSYREGDRNRARYIPR